jgi:hypothetical protein
MLHFRQHPPSPTGVVPQASQGLDESSMEKLVAKTLYKAIAETAHQRKGGIGG